ncbi:MAG: hypothetical protein Q4D45_11850 [Lachnospiraceae bacterium]|nr:hypothetical protein [Lachnospiraceae bacterium]
MSRAVALDHEFNKEKFQNLLNLAKGSRSQKDFARDANLSLAYVCKHLNGTLDVPPVPKTLFKIAHAAQNDITYEDLLDAAGYDTDKAVYNTPSTSLDEKENLDNKYASIILNALRNLRYNPTIDTSNRSPISNLTVYFSDGPINKWSFIFHPEQFMIQNFNLQDRLLLYYGRLATLHDQSVSKFSFVTDSKDTFNEILKLEPYRLNVIISAILVDTKNFNIQKEVYLKSHNSFTEETQNTFKLCH